MPEIMFFQKIERASRALRGPHMENLMENKFNSHIFWSNTNEKELTIDEWIRHNQ